jgi:uncharacterized NAD(P)/FAD-binding protein YdhS
MGKCLAQAWLKELQHLKRTSMTAFIVYDSFALAWKANAILQSVAASEGNSFDWNILPWRTQLLRFNPAARLALNEARDAHLLVFAWDRSHPLPAWLEDWLEAWAANRTIKEAALAFVGDTTVHRGADAVTELSDFAARHGLGLILGDENVPEFSVSAPVLMSRLTSSDHRAAV